MKNSKMIKQLDDFISKLNKDLDSWKCDLQYDFDNNFNYISEDDIDDYLSYMKELLTIAAQRNNAEKLKASL